ncbi:unnamed protein product [Paramecium pentaurelia]|uniref:Protein kinase domain-containing protein n=1 Tax=Paramecium pentaurelia TaxID=43138 RepID=A0A8S1X2C3_9CILI|nr:unnamed protein product [Paramecium pentaurelia]
MKNDFQKKIDDNDKKNYEQLLDEQITLCQDEENCKYIFRIDNYRYDEKQNKFIINYNFKEITQNISQEAKSLSQVQLKTLEEKLNIFDQLLELAEFLKKKKIIHNNIKKNNLILYNNKLYLTDFGYLQEQDESNIFMDQKNFVRTLNQDQQRQIYPYQSYELLEILNKYYLQNEELMEKLEQRTQKDIQVNDQHVLTVMMFEIFYYFDKNYQYNLQNSLKCSKKAVRKNQLQWMKERNQDVQDYILIIIQQILKKRFIIDNELLENFPKSLSGCIFQIDREKLINIDNQKLVQEYFENKILEFDQELLYCFTYKELQQLQGQIQNPQNQFEQDLKQEIEKIQKLYDNIDNKQLNKENFQQLELEKQFICLVYLDQKIDEFDFVKNQDQSQEVKKLLDYYNLKQELKEFYTQINKKQQNFKFNRQIKIKSRIQSEPPPQQINQSLQQSQLNPLYKIDRERLINIDNQKLVQEYFEHKILEFDQQFLYYFTYQELQKLLNQIQKQQDQFEKDLKQAIEKIMENYDKIDKNNFNKENFKDLSSDEQFICLVYLDQKINEFDNIQNQDQSQEAKKLLDYYNLKQELKEFYDEVNHKQQKDFKFNSIKIKVKIQQYKINKEKLINIKNNNKQLAEEQNVNEIKKFVQQLLYYFTYKELLYILSQIQEQKNKFEKDLKQAIEKIMENYDKIDKKEFNKENFKDLSSDEQFICLVYLDQKINEFDNIQNQDQSQEAKKLLLDYYNLKQELKEFYIQINKKQQNFKFNNLINQRYQYLIDKENQNIVQEYFEHKILEFDQQFLYYFTYQELQKLLNQIQKQQDQFEKDLKQAIEKIMENYDKIDKNNFNKENFKDLSSDEQFICLVYLDQKINEFDNIQNQDQSQEAKKLLDYYNLKQELKEFYDEVNNKQQKDFKFNSIKIKLKIQQYKINKEKLINIKNNNKQLADEQIEKEILEFVQQLLYYFTYKEIKNILNQFQNPQNKFQKDLKQEIEKIQKLYDKIDKNEFNKENFKQLELEEQFICLVYLDQKIDEFDINQNQDQYQEVKKLLDYYTLKQELKEFYVEINDKQQKDFNFNNLKKQRFQYLIDEEKQNLVQEYFKHKILEFDQQLLYYFTYKEIKKILNQFQNPQNKFQKDLKLKIEKIQKFYDMIDKNEFNKENFKQLELEEKFICLVYLDQKIDEFDCDKNQDQSQEVDRLLDYYNLKYELKEFYDEVNNKQQKDFKFNNPIKIKYGNQFLYEYINQITLRLQSDKYLVQQVDLNNMILNIPNQEQQQIEFKQIKQDKNTFQFIIHKFFLQNDLYYCKYLEVKEQKRNFEPMVIMNFNLIKEYRFEDYNSKVRLIDHKKKFKYFGEYQLDEQGEIKFNGQGTKEILEKDKEILETGQVFKVKGNFKNNQLNGKSITFYHHYDESKITFSIGEYKDGQMSGQHIHYPVNDQKILKTTYHWKFLKYFNYYFETG